MSCAVRIFCCCFPSELLLLLFQKLQKKSFSSAISSCTLECVCGSFDHFIRVGIDVTSKRGELVVHCFGKKFHSFRKALFRYERKDSGDIVHSLGLLGDDLPYGCMCEMDVDLVRCIIVYATFVRDEIYTPSEDVSGLV